MTASDRCAAEVIQHDDRWGGIRDRCELDAGHDGSHRASRDACEPKAWLTWDAPPPDPWEGLADAMEEAWERAWTNREAPNDCYLAEIRAALDWLREHPEAGLPGGLELSYTVGAEHEGPGGWHYFRMPRKDGDR